MKDPTRRTERTRQARKGFVTLPAWLSSASSSWPPSAPACSSSARQGTRTETRMPTGRRIRPCLPLECRISASKSRNPSSTWDGWHSTRRPRVSGYCATPGRVPSAWGGHPSKSWRAADRPSRLWVPQPLNPGAKCRSSFRFPWVCTRAWTARTSSGSSCHFEMRAGKQAKSRCTSRPCSSSQTRKGAGCCPARPAKTLHLIVNSRFKNW